MRDEYTLVHLVVDGEVITTTEEHPFFVSDKGWVIAKELAINDRLVASDGSTKTVELISEEQLERPVKVYNFAVEDYHTYYVGSGVLVHNNCGVNEVCDTKVTRKAAFREAKEAAGIPKSAQYSTHRFVYDSSTENRIVYEFKVDGKSKYIIEHMDDKLGRGNHFHIADASKGNPFCKGRYNQFRGHFPEDIRGFR